MKIIAHKKIVGGKTLYEDLKHHQSLTARMARRFGRPFNTGSYCFDMAMNHDMGKTREGFQKYIKGEDIPLEERMHSAVGSLAALKEKDNELIPMAACIYGHHGHIPNIKEWVKDKNWKEKIEKPYAQVIKKGARFFKKHMFRFESWYQGCSVNRRFTFAVFIRFLYSCLCDADWVATENYMNPEAYKMRLRYPSLRRLLVMHKKYMAKVRKNADRTFVNKIRSAVHRTCCLSARAKQGFFSLEGPTGVGKTYSYISWGLRHAIEHKLNRVIVVLPYTSIIDQVVTDLRKIFGHENVIEHHSAREAEAAYEGLTPKAAAKLQRRRYRRHEMTIENWAAPIIVTTSVQFFESLFGHYRGRLRKVHNIANSVVVLDELQTLPEGNLKPIIMTMKVLVERFKVSFLFSTATQPALKKRVGFDGIDKIHPILKMPQHLFEALRRVKVVYSRKLQTFEDVIDKIKRHKQVLTIVNTKKVALELALQIPESIVLSGYIIPKHRRKIIRRIKSLLDKGEECKVISTQVVEAGVDIDFPVVFREYAPYSSIVQSAGRCNREGKLKLGYMWVFDLDRPQGFGKIQGDYARGTEQFRIMLKKYGYLDIYDVSTYEEYFSQLYQKIDLDKNKIIDLQEQLNFSEVNKNFKMIDQALENLIIPCDDISLDVIQKILDGDYKPEYMRILYQYSLNMFSLSREKWEMDGLIYSLFEKDEDSKAGGVYYLNPQVINEVYDPEKGLMPDSMGYIPLIL